MQDGEQKASQELSMSFTRATRPFHKVLIRSVKPILPLSQSRAMHVQSLPMWTGKGNNYAYLVTDEPTQQSVIIDPANPPE
jgi:hydroxyacylglutathione hydrolase